MAVSDVAVALSVVAGVLSAVAQAAVLAARRRQHRLTKKLTERPLPTDFAEDLAAVHDRLFNDVGRLSLQEYVADRDARKVVERAATHAQRLVDANEPPSSDATKPAAGGGHLEIARSALAEGDTVAALARSRLALEVALRDLAEIHGVDARRQTGGRLIRQLVQVGVITPSLASIALEAFQIASRGLHGEDVTPADAESAVSAINRFLTSTSGQRG